MVQGLDKVRRQFAALPAALEADLRATMEKTAEEVVAQMRAVAPKGETGDLARSINWTWGEAPAGAMVIGRVGKRKENKSGRTRERTEGLRITIYAGQGDAFYALFHEFGTVKMPARPFFFPVYRANRNLIRRRIGAAIRRAAKAASN